MQRVRDHVPVRTRSRTVRRTGHRVQRLTGTIPKGGSKPLPSLPRPTHAPARAVGGALSSCPLELRITNSGFAGSLTNRIVHRRVGESPLLAPLRPGRRVQPITTVGPPYDLVCRAVSDGLLNATANTDAPAHQWHHQRRFFRPADQRSPPPKLTDFRPRVFAENGPAFPVKLTPRFDAFAVMPGRIFRRFRNEKPMVRLRLW